MYTQVDKTIQRERRKARVRARVSGSTERPRMAVFRSNRYLYVQLIDDLKHITMLSASDKAESEELKAIKLDSAEREGKVLTPKVEIAYKLGKLLAMKAKEKKITAVVFDRAGYKYHGRVRALADGARAGGLQF